MTKSVFDMKELDPISDDGAKLRASGLLTPRSGWLSKSARYTVQQRLEPVRLTCLPGNTVSCIARSHGMIRLCFRRRALDKQGRIDSRAGRTKFRSGQTIC